MGVPPPQSQLFFTLFLDPESGFLPKNRFFDGKKRPCEERQPVTRVWELKNRFLSLQNRLPSFQNRLLSSKNRLLSPKTRFWGKKTPLRGTTARHGGLARPPALFLALKPTSRGPRGPRGPKGAQGAQGALYFPIALRGSAAWAKPFKFALFALLPYVALRDSP